MLTKFSGDFVQSHLAMIVAAAMAAGVMFGQCMAAETGEARSQMLMFTTEPVDPAMTNEDGKRVLKDAWIREVVRQAILMAARDECGLATRDETLGEPIDRESPECIRVEVFPWKRGGVDVRLSRDEQTFLEQTIDIDMTLIFEFPPLVEQMQKMSRAEFADGLEKIGYPRQPLAEGNLDKLPDEIVRLLQQMNHVSQYAALRRLHRMLHESGESPAILGGLVRGYAHLTQLMLPVLDVRYKALGARALLYAQRMVHLQPDSPVGYWHRAYAFTWIGYANKGIRNLKMAQRLVEAADVEPLEWVKLIDDYHSYRFDQLQQAAQNEESPERQTAAVLWFLASRMVSSDAFTIETGEQAMKVAPLCLRILVGMSECAGVAYNHRLSGAGPILHTLVINKHLDEVADLPEGIELNVGVADNQSTLMDPIEKLFEAGVDDLAEPSFSMLADNLRAWNSEHLFRRAHFLRSYLGIDAGSFVEPMLSAMEDDPFFPLFRAMGVPRLSRAEETTEVTRNFKMREMNFVSVGYDILGSLPLEAALADGTIRELRLRSWRSASYLEDEARKRIRSLSGNNRLNQAAYLKHTSVHAPMHFSEQIILGWDDVVGNLEGWREKYSAYPDLHWALARGYKSAGEIEKSIECYNRYVSMVSDAHGYIGLAEVYYMSGDDKKWLDTLQTAFDCEDYELTHALAAQHAASTLMHEGRFEEARDWAEQSAASYSSWGVECLIECLTALGDFAEAESLASQMTSRYQNSAWYDWCAETGKGDIERAWEAKQKHLRRTSSAEDYSWRFAQVYHLLVTGEEKDARQSLAEQFEVQFNAWNGLMLALLSDRAGDDSARDSALQRLADCPADDPQHTPLCDLAVVFQHAIEAGELDQDEFRETLRRVSTREDWSPAFGLFSGYYLSTHGQQQRAIAQWKIPAGVHSRSWTRILAWVWLREEGIDPIHVGGRWFYRTFQRWQPQPEQLESKETEADTDTD